MISNAPEFLGVSIFLKLINECVVTQKQLMAGSLGMLGLTLFFPRWILAL